MMLRPLLAIRLKLPSRSMSSTVDCGTILIVFAATTSKKMAMMKKKNKKTTSMCVPPKLNQG
jgi:hypothetical protein